MYLTILLLITLAFGRPNSAQLDVGANNVNQLDFIVHFSNEMGSLLGDSRLIGTVSEELEAADQNLLEMERGLNTLQGQVPALQRQSMWSYAVEFNKTKSYLQQARQELRDMADNAVKEVRDMTLHLEEFDSNNDTDLLKLTMIITKDLMIETKEKLEEVREKYQSVHQDIDNLISSVESHVMEIVGQAVIRLDCQTAAWDTLGICASVNHYVNENSRVELGDLKSKLERFLEITRFLKQDIDVAIDLIDDKIDQINTWAENTENVDENIEEFPAEYLEKYIDLRTVFRNGLNKLENVAEQFLVDRITTSSRFAEQYQDINTSRLLGTNDEHRRFAEKNERIVEYYIVEILKKNIFEPSYFRGIIYLRRTIQELRELARRTIVDVRDMKIMLEAIDETTDSSAAVYSLEISMSRMKDLIILTLKTLKKNNEKHQLALFGFENLKSNLQHLDTDRLFGRIKILNRDIDDAEVVIHGVLDLISMWTQSAKIVSDNLEEYSVGYLRVLEPFRAIFKHGLNQLENITENYLGQTM